MWQEQNPYGASGSQSAYYAQNLQPQTAPLQFYAPASPDAGGFYSGSRPSLEGTMGSQGSIRPQGAAPAYGGNIQTQQPWWTAFGTGGFEGEPPLLEELGINFSHIRGKSMTVLNPMSRIDEHIMDDADLAGPIIYVFCFGMFLLLSGKPNFGYIYGVGLFGSMSLYILLNLMSERPIDAFRVTSVLGYCLLPMVGVSAVSVMVTLDGMFGYLLSFLSVLWCTYSASGIFVSVLQMSQQRVLVAYPVLLLYGCFALLSVFDGTGTAK
ncbi:Yip1-domain-containing protein [Schizophyllum commune]